MICIRFLLLLFLCVLSIAQEQTIKPTTIDGTIVQVLGRRGIIRFWNAHEGNNTAKQFTLSVTSIVELDASNRIVSDQSLASQAFSLSALQEDIFLGIPCQKLTLQTTVHTTATLKLAVYLFSEDGTFNNTRDELVSVRMGQAMVTVGITDWPWVSIGDSLVFTISLKGKGSPSKSGETILLGDGGRIILTKTAVIDDVGVVSVKPSLEPIGINNVLQVAFPRFTHSALYALLIDTCPSDITSPPFVQLSPIDQEASNASEFSSVGARKVVYDWPNSLRIIHHTTNMAAKEISHSTEDNFQLAGVDVMAKAIKSAIQARNRAFVGLSGGSTPWPIYRKLAQDSSIDWSKVHLFLVDDRYISADSHDSNQRLVKEIFGATGMPSANILMPDTSLPIAEAVEDYSRKLTALYASAENQTVDLLVLGLGDDGHICSLFPTVSQEVLDSKKGVVHTTTTRFAVFDRISIDFSLLRASREYVFFLKGANKIEVWNNMKADLSAHGVNLARWPAHEVIQSPTTTCVQMS